MIEAIAIGVFLFVSIVVAGWRAIDLIETRKAERKESAVAKIRRLERATEYRGRSFGRWER